MPESGKFGVVNGENTIRNWSVNQTSTPQKYVASNTRGGSGRKHGVQDFNGQFGGYGGSPVVLPGELFSFSGYTAPDNGTEGGTGELWTGPAIVDSVAITWGWSAAEIISYVANFSGDGPLTNATGVHSDGSDPSVPQSCGFAPMIEGTALEDVVSAVLTITAENQSYANSSTIFDVDGNQECWTRRKRGNIDFTLSITQQNHEGLGAIDVTNDVIVKLPVTDALTGGWELKWCHSEAMSSLNVDRESGAIIGRTLNFSMNGFNPAIGFIKKPGGTDFWPTALSS